MSFDTARILEEIQSDPPAKSAKAAKTRAEISDISNQHSENFSDFDNPEIIRRLDEGEFEYKDFPRYEAALQQGLLVICRRCEFYKGPHAKALGWCRKFDTEAAPDVPFTCGAASRA